MAPALTKRSLFAGIAGLALAPALPAQLTAAQIVDRVDPLAWGETSGGLWMSDRLYALYLDDKPSSVRAFLNRHDYARRD